MATLTEEQQEINTINSMDHESMCKMWRNAPSGHKYFDKTKPYSEIFRKRLFDHFGGFTPAISKSIGW